MNSPISTNSGDRREDRVAQHRVSRLVGELHGDAEIVEQQESAAERHHPEHDADMEAGDDQADQRDQNDYEDDIRFQNALPRPRA